ncbi:HepT-like ribonuclease domain-containing protein [Deinococcus taklimakanensis]|uniref:HepT-like ribonuclease domain-containing protein n=1 Tax=Deinococcus taklimakanensis TaxID=536443 RepID=A0ABW5P2R3_9DEIO
MSAPLFPDLRLQSVAALVREGEAQWRSLGVTRVRVFGSVARGEAGANADIDLLVDFAPGEEPGLLHLMRVKEVLEDLLDRRADVVLEASLRPPLRGEILADAVDVMAVPPVPSPSHRVKRWRWRLFELLDTLDRLFALTAPLTLGTFRMREEVQDAVLLGLLRLGETTKYIPQSVQDRHPEVPWADLRDIRNLVAHDYFGLAPELVWRTVREELPALRPRLQALTDSAEPDLIPSSILPSGPGQG